MTKEQVKLVNDYESNPFPLSEKSKRAEKTIEVLKAMKDFNPMKILHEDNVLDFH